jgi:hypothetical protein
MIAKQPHNEKDRQGPFKMSLPVFFVMNDILF